MISPFTGGHATLKYENRELEYRKEKYPYVAQFYEDDETHEQFTTTEMDEANLAQVYNQYRAAYSVPFVDEIIALREKYGLSALKMSAILGFGDNHQIITTNKTNKAQNGFGGGHKRETTHAE